jgi:outer membrane lipoprotein YfiO
MKLLCVLLGSLALVLCGFAQQNPSASSAANQGRAQLQAELRSLAALAQKIGTAGSHEEKARGWLELNRQAKKFGEEMNAAFPDTSIKGDKISPAEAQQLAQTAKSYGVRVDFCEPGGNWAADNQGYFKYLELWPNGPEADEATWMGPMGNASFCGDSEGSAEELKEFIAQRKQFLQKFPNSRFATQAKQDVIEAQAQLQEALRSGR